MVIRESFDTSLMGAKRIRFPAHGVGRIRRTTFRTRSCSAMPPRSQATPTPSSLGAPARAPTARAKCRVVDGSLVIAELKDMLR